MISGISSMNAYSYSGAVSGGLGAGKLYVPVQPGMVIYSQFEHVSGIAAGKGQNGVTIDKVQILNRLIDQLVNMKKNPTPISSESQELSETQVDALIKDYQGKIQDTVAAAKMNPYIMGGASIPSTGVIFDIAA